MKNILFVVLHLGYGGVEQATINEANILSEHFNVSIVSTYKLLDKPAFRLNESVKVMYLLSGKPNKNQIMSKLRHFRLLGLLSEIIKGIQILYCKKKSIIKYLNHTQYDFIISTRYYYDRILSREYNGNAVLLAREHRHHNNDGRYIKKLCNAVKDFDYFLPVSKESADFYRNELQGEKVKVCCLPNFIESIPDRGPASKDKNLIAVGRLSVEKGFVEIIDIISDIKSEFPDVKFHLIGDGVERETIENRIEELHCQDNVILHGFQNREYINDRYEKSAIYLMTSFEEAFPIVLLEAQSYGLPCIAYDSAQGAREIIEDGISGYLINGRNRETFVEKIRLLLSDDVLYHTMSNAAYTNAKSYSKENIWRKWIEIINTTHHYQAINTLTTTPPHYTHID